jgi:hypothetical protein
MEPPPFEEPPMTRISLLSFAAAKSVRPVAALRIAVEEGLTLNVYASEGMEAEEGCDLDVAIEAAEIDPGLVWLGR